jgi:hypothetical protein
MRKGWVKWYYVGNGTGVLLEQDEHLLVSFNRASIRDPSYSPKREDPVSFELYGTKQEGFTAQDVVYGHQWRSHGST